MSAQHDILKELHAMLAADEHVHYFAVCWECASLEMFDTKQQRDRWVVEHEHALVGPRAP